MLLVSLILMSFAITSQSDETLPASARRQGGEATVLALLNSPGGSLDRVVRESSLIVLGKVRSVSTELSPDQTRVLTTYHLRPLNIYKGEGDAGSLALPKEIDVQRPGGTVVMDGLRMTYSVSDFPPTAVVEPGEIVIVFARPSSLRSDAYELTRGPFGPLRVDGVTGRITQMDEAVTQRRPAVPDKIADLEALLNGIIKG
jgi:hypothetical protein